MLKLLTLLLTSSMTVMAGAAIAPALPKIQAFFGIPTDAPEALQVKLLLTLPALFTAIGGLASGWIIDRWGRKLPLAIAVALYGLAGCSGLWLNDLGAMLVGRALLGLSVAMIAPASAALIADYFQGPQRTRLLGLQAAAMGFGGVLFLLVGGAVAVHSWRFPFLIYLMAVIALPLVLQLPDPDRDVPKHFELQASGPSRLPTRIITGIYGLTGLAMLIFYMVPVQLPFYLQSLNLGGSWESGLAIALCTLASAIVSLNYAWIKARLSFPQVLLCLFCCMASGYGILANATRYGIVVLGLLIAGAGLGLLLPNMNVWLNRITPPKQRGRVLGGLTTCMFLGQFLSPFAVQPIAQRFGLQSAYMLAAGLLFAISLSIATYLVITTSSGTSERSLR